MSIIHRIHPIIKFLGFIAFIAVIFLPISFFLQTIVWIGLTTIFFLAKLSFGRYWKLVKTAIIIFSIFFFFNWLILKDPLLVNLPNGLWCGSAQDLINASPFLSFANNQTVASALFGGISPIPFTLDGFSYNNHFYSLNTLFHIYVQNNGGWQPPQSLLLNNFHKLPLSEQNGLIAQGGRESALKYAWLLANGIQLNNVNWTFQIGVVHNVNWALPNQIFVYRTQWYTLSPRAIQLTLYMTMKVFLILLSGAILTLTTPAVEIAFVLSKLFSPLKVLRLPVNEVAMMLSIAINFIPILAGETKRITNAQANRGCDFRSHNPITKLKALGAIILPMFTVSLNQAENLTVAMTARGYQPFNGIRWSRKFKLSLSDYGYTIIFLAFLSVAIAFTRLHFVFAPFGLFELGCVIK